MKLKSILLQQPLEILKQIIDFWNIDHPEPVGEQSKSVPTDVYVEYLFQRMQNKVLFEQAFSKLDAKEKDLIFLLIIHGGDIDESELIHRTPPIDRKRLPDLIYRLSLSGFVFRDKINEEGFKGELLGVPEPYLRFIDLPPYWEGYLGYFLQALPYRKIRHIGQEGLGIKYLSNKKNVLIHQIRKSLLNPHILAQQIQNLIPEERGVFKTIQSKNGFCIYRDLLDTGYQKRYDHAKAEFVNSLIAQSGLLFIAVPNENKYNSLLMVPKDIYYIINQNFVEDLRDLKSLDTVSAFGQEVTPAITGDNSFNLLRDLVFIVSLIDRNKVRRLSTGGIGKNELRKIIPHISSLKTEKYVHFLATFCISKKFLISVGEIWQVSERFFEWLADSHHAFAELFEWWELNNEWNEEFIDGNVVHNEEDTSRLVNAPELRKKVLQSLSTLPPHHWIKFSGFADTILPKIESSIPRRSNSQILEKTGRTNYFTIESIVGECCYWLGIVSIGLEDKKSLEKLACRGDKLKNVSPATRRPKLEDQIGFYFKLTPLGECIVNSMEYTEGGEITKTKCPDLFMQIPMGVQHFVLQPNLEIIAPPDLNLQILYRLCEIALVKNVDVMTTLFLNKDTIRNALDSGLSGNEILEFLQQYGRGAVPDTVRHLIQECGKKHGELNIALATGYIKTEDPVLFEELRRNKRFKEAIKDIVDQSTFIIHPGYNLQKLATELQKSGFMPHIESESVQLGKHGKIHLSLSQEEYLNLIAILRLIQLIEDELGESATEDKTTPLMEKIKAEVKGSQTLTTFGIALSKTFYKRFMGILGNLIDQRTQKYKKQISRLMTTVPRTPNKYEFDGPNPASDKKDIKKMIVFAVKNELPLEIRYLNRHEEENKDILEPESIDGNKVYGFFKYKDDYSVIHADRIIRSKLL